MPVSSVKIGGSANCGRNVAKAVEEDVGSSIGLSGEEPPASLSSGVSSAAMWLISRLLERSNIE